MYFLRQRFDTAARDRSNFLWLDKGSHVDVTASLTSSYTCTPSAKSPSIGSWTSKHTCLTLALCCPWLSSKLLRLIFIFSKDKKKKKKKQLLDEKKDVHACGGSRSMNPPWLYVHCNATKIICRGVPFFLMTAKNWSDLAKYILKMNDDIIHP